MVNSMPPISGIRAVTVAAGALGGIILLGTGIGAITARIAAPANPFLMAAGVTAAVAFITGMLAGPPLLRLARLRGSQRLGTSASAPKSTR
jgi:hypothetical protein